MSAVVNEGRLRILPILVPLFLVALAVAAATYHPVYFGDELFSFEVTPPGRGVLASTLEMSRYKPRLIMNLFWGMVASYQLPRWVPMLGFVASLAIAAWQVWLLAIERFDADRRHAWIAALLVLLSRFDIMLYFDYVSGTVEAFSLALFLYGVRKLFDAWRFDRGLVRWRPALLALVAFVGCILSHERYIAGLAGLSAGMGLWLMASAEWRRSLRSWVYLAMLPGVPALAYVLLVALMSYTSVLTGTSGSEVKPGLATFQIALTYASNVLLGSNFGPNWFVGTLDPRHPWHAATFLVSAIFFGLAWLIPWLSRKGEAVSTRHLPAATTLMAAAVGMMLVASLPGADRQEARWMLPVLAMTLSALLALYRTWSVAALLTLFVVSQVFYFTFGGLGAISSIRVSRMAGALGQAVAAIDLPGRSGVMVAAPEPETSWMLGDNGEPFCRVNLGGDNCLYPRDSSAARGKQAAAFGLVYTGTALTSPPTYRFVSEEQAAFALSPATATGGEVIGAAGAWQGWTLSTSAREEGGDLVLSAVSDNFLRVDAQRLDGTLLVYEARAQRVPAQMRLQVNWHRKDDSFIAAQLEVVELKAERSAYTTFLSAPAGAAYGYVYATVHDGSPNSAIISSIRLAR